jgi:hypothetical protein
LHLTFTSFAFGHDSSRAAWMNDAAREARPPVSPGQGMACAKDERQRIIWAQAARVASVAVNRGA